MTIPYFPFNPYFPSSKNLKTLYFVSSIQHLDVTPHRWIYILVLHLLLFSTTALSIFQISKEIPTIFQFSYFPAQKMSLLILFSLIFFAITTSSAPTPTRNPSSLPSRTAIPRWTAIIDARPTPRLPPLQTTFHAPVPVETIFDLPGIPSVSIPATSLASTRPFPRGQPVEPNVNKEVKSGENAITGRSIDDHGNEEPPPSVPDPDGAPPFLMHHHDPANATPAGEGH